MLFNSLGYLGFFLVVSIVHFTCFKQYQWFWLLICSYYFYMNWNARFALLMLASTLITYGSGIGIGYVHEKANVKKLSGAKAKRWAKSIVFLSFAANLGILFYYKYFGFSLELAQWVAKLLPLRWELSIPETLLPVGISFYTFQALGYTIDVYRGDTAVQRHFGRYALFVSFFPQLVAGPIERSWRLLKQLEAPKTFDGNRMTSGLIQMGWGFFQKVVVADRLAIFVNAVYNDITSYEGVTLVVATVFFAFQIYCDFAGYSNIAIGSAKVLGIELMANFNGPYFSRSFGEFWHRWHISLSQWFRDYLYIPLGGNRVTTWRKCVNTMIVFLCSGLWHGASFTFVFWGGLHGIFLVVGDLTNVFRKRFYDRLHIDTEKFGFKLGQTVVVFGLTCFSWILFRANTIRDAWYAIKNLLVFNYWVLADDSLLRLGLDTKEMGAALLSIIILVLVERAWQKKDLVLALQNQNRGFRWLVYIAFVLGMVVFGVYGEGYIASEFIYFQF